MFQEILVPPLGSNSPTLLGMPNPKLEMIYFETSVTTYQSTRREVSENPTVKNSSVETRCILYDVGTETSDVRKNLSLKNLKTF
jgi:hypothetical protein